MQIEVGTSGAESVFENAVVEISRQPVISSHRNINGSVQIQKAPTMKRIFTVILVKPTSTEVTNIETEHDKAVTLWFIHNSTTYTVRFDGPLDRSTQRYDITFTLQEV